MDSISDLNRLRQGAPGVLWWRVARRVFVTDEGRELQPAAGAQPESWFGWWDWQTGSAWEGRESTHAVAIESRGAMAESQRSPIL